MIFLTIFGRKRTAPRRRVGKPRPFLGKVVILREIENFRQIDGNSDSLLNLFSACRRAKGAVDFLGCPCGKLFRD